MTTKNYSLLVGVMLLAILLTNFGLFIAPVFSSESVEQDRTVCLSRCNSPTGRGAEMYFEVQGTTVCGDSVQYVLLTVRKDFGRNGRKEWTK